jgi:nucleoside-diphosphate-sugar epimerase
MEVAGKSGSIVDIAGPVGVRNRNSHNELIEARLGWKPTEPLIEGLSKIYPWIESQIERMRGNNKIGVAAE